MSATGVIDNRIYVDWSSAPYNKIVQIGNDGSWCTGQYVAPNIISTARHCVADTPEFDNYVKIGATNISATTHDNHIFRLKVIAYGKNFNDDDWALLLVNDPKYYHTESFTSHPADATNTIVDNAGFGFMRILTDNEIAKLRQIWSNVENSMTPQAMFLDIYDNALDAISDAGIPPLDDNPHNLKAHLNCQLLDHNKYYNTKPIKTNCDTFAGNSGGPYYKNGTLYAIHSSAVGDWTDKNIAYATPSALFYQKLQEAKAKFPPQTGSQTATSNNKLKIYGKKDAPTLKKPDAQTTKSQDEILDLAQEQIMATLDEDIAKLENEEIILEDDFIELNNTPITVP